MNNEIKELSADPYDDQLMENFCNYISLSQKKIEKVEKWIKEIYSPINRLISQIIKPLNNEIKELSADPYDDQLMENFCSYIIL